MTSRQRRVSVVRESEPENLNTSSLYFSKNLTSEPKKKGKLPYLWGVPSKTSGVETIEI